MRRPRVALLLLALCIGCTGAPGSPAPAPAPPVPVPRTEPWPAGDALFRSDPRWLGGDSAYSVPLDADDGRALWLFGDSFVSLREPHDRRDSTLVRNSVAIQEEPDPSRATLQFHWRTGADGAPRSFIPDGDEDWFWPLHGIRRPEGLTLFLLRVREAPDTPLGFETRGWTALRVADPDAPPPSWDLRFLRPFPSPFPVVVGASVLEHDVHLLAYAVQEPGDHHVYLVRWRTEDFAAGRLAEAQWWDGERGWIHRKRLATAPTPVFRHGATELSVTFSDVLDRYVAVHDGPFGDDSIMIRTAPTPRGPWSTPRETHRPADADPPGVFAYAAKAHPWLEGADLMVTYATNTRAPEALLDRPHLYYPRFVRLHLRRP